MVIVVARANDETILIDGLGPAEMAVGAIQRTQPQHLTVYPDEGEMVIAIFFPAGAREANDLAGIVDVGGPAVVPAERPQVGDAFHHRAARINGPHRRMQGDAHLTVAANDPAQTNNEEVNWTSSRRKR